MDNEQRTTNNQIMQNKPNFRSYKMNTTILLTKDYEQITMNNEPIKTNPIKPNFIRFKQTCPPLAV